METFTQPTITGYRQLTPYEVALVNEGKALAEQCGAFIEKLRASDPSGKNPIVDLRWVNIGATDIQKGWLCVICGIAQQTNS